MPRPYESWAHEYHATHAKILSFSRPTPSRGSFMPIKKCTSFNCRIAVLTWVLLAAAAVAETDQPLEDPPASESDQAFAELLGTLQAKWDLFLDPRWGLRNPDTIAEGRVMLLNMLNHALDVHLSADPARPVFQKWIGPYKKLLGDNPNADYYDARVDARYSYRISGNISHATYTSFAVELSEGGVGATLNDTQMQLAEDGSYEIMVSAEPPESGNWLRLDPKAMSITTRHYFETQHNVGSDPAFRIDLNIERLEFPGASPLPSAATTTSGLRRMTYWLKRNVFPPLPERSPDWISQTPNEFSNPGGENSNLDINYAAADNVYRMTRWQLAPDEALVITGRFPDCRFANVVLYNDYLQTLPYRYRQISLNRKQVRLQPDGSFRVIIAHNDPGEPNWLDTGGREEGVIFWRFLLPAEPVPALQTHVMLLSDL